MLAENPSIHSIEKLLAVIAPGSTGSAAKPLPGSYSNLTHLVEAVDPGGTVKKYVVRRYVHGDRAQKARVEHPSGHLAWARALGEMLAKIHSVPLPQDTSFLLDGNAEVVWFLKSSAVPAYMTNHPEGRMVWRMVKDWLPRIQPFRPALMHIDYWRGNVLWHQGNISAVVDWEEAAFGDPGYDAAYCTMELIIMGMIEEAETFLQVYETEMGQAVANFGIWGLAAAVRPMYDIDGWITEPETEDRLRDFIAHAKRKLKEAG